MTAKKFHTLITLKGQSTSLLKSTKIHFPEGFNRQSKETTNTISSTRSPDSNDFCLQELLNMLLLSAKIHSSFLVPVCLIVKVRIHCCKIIAKLLKSVFYLLKRLGLGYIRIKLKGQGEGINSQTRCNLLGACPFSPFSALCHTSSRHRWAAR